LVQISASPRSRAACRIDGFWKNGSQVVQLALTMTI